MKKNYRKSVLIITSILIVILVSIFIYKNYESNKYPTSTGGDVPLQIPPDVVSETEAMSKLSASLPISTPQFTITFSYKNGKYIVSGVDSANLQSDFDNWYANSEYTAIPKTRFQISK